MIYSEENQQYELVGIISSRLDCTDEGLFTRIAPFINWITDTLADPPATPPPLPTLPPTRPTVLTTTTPEVLGNGLDLSSLHTSMYHEL